MKFLPVHERIVIGATRRHPLLLGANGIDDKPQNDPLLDVRANHALGYLVRRIQEGIGVATDSSICVKHHCHAAE